jgi:hypothetical protein
MIRCSDVDMVRSLSFPPASTCFFSQNARIEKSVGHSAAHFDRMELGFGERGQSGGEQCQGDKALHEDGPS